MNTRVSRFRFLSILFVLITGVIAALAKTRDSLFHPGNPTPVVNDAPFPFATLGPISTSRNGVLLPSSPQLASRLSTLSESFASNHIDATKWLVTTTGSMLIQANNHRLEITTDGTGSATLTSLLAYNALDDSLTIEYLSIPGTSNSMLTEVRLAADPDNLVYLRQQQGTSKFRFRMAIDGVSSDIGDTLELDLSLMRLWRLRESGGVLYADYSSDGMRWINPPTWAISTPIDFSSVHVSIFAQNNSDSGIWGIHAVDNINVDVSRVPRPAQMLWSLPGMTTPTSAIVVVKTDSAARTVTLRYSTMEDVSYYVETGPQRTLPDGYYLTTFELGDLAPSVQYYYQIKVDDVLYRDTGRFRTAPPTGTPWSGKLAFGNCASTGSSADTFSRILAHRPEVVLHLGDLHYTDIVDNDESLYHEAYDNSIGVPEQNLLYRSCAFFYIPEDHDGGPDNRTKVANSLPALVTAYQRAIPHAPLPGIEAGNMGLYQSAVRGRIRFIFVDVRNERDAPGLKASMLGSRQKQWLKDEMLAAKGEGQGIVWISGVPWAGSDSPVADGWRGYAEERRELADFIYDNDLVKRIVMLFGDAHALIFDNGSHSNYRTDSGVNEKAFVMFSASPFDRPSSVKDAHYTDFYPPLEDEDVRQYGIMDFLDTGGQSIAITFSGFKTNDDLWRKETVYLTVASLPAAARTSEVRVST